MALHFRKLFSLLRRHHLAFGLWLTFLILAGAVGAAFAAECPLDADPTKYAAPYTSPIGLPRCTGTIGRWTVCEICLTSDGTNYSEKDAYTLSYPTSGTGLQPRATFSQGATSLTVDGFFDGLVSSQAVFRVRFAPTTSAGRWNYSTTSSDTGLSLSGSFTAGTSTAKGFLRRSTAYPERFVYDDGSYFFMWGQTYYQLITKVRNDTVPPTSSTYWKKSIDNSVGKGMNKLRTLLYPFGDYLPYGDSQPFSDGTTHDTLDLTHWQKFDEIPNYLSQRSMITEIILFSTNGSSYSVPLNDSTGQAQARDQRYVRYAIARYAAFPNVIWCLTNEWQLSPYTSASYWNQIGNIVHNQDPWLTQGSSLRPLSIHNRTDHLFKFFNQAWPVHAVLQDGTNNGRPNRSDPDPPHFDNGDEWGNYSIANNLGHGMPVVNDEYGYIGDTQTTTGPFDRTEHRQAMWGIAMAGGYGSAGDLRTVSGQDVTISGDWKDEPEYSDVQALTRLFTSYFPNWWKMSRDTQVASGSRVYALSEPNARYVVYAALGGTVTVNLPAGPTGQWTWQICDPRGGTCDNVSRVINGGSPQTLTLPDGQDWAILLVPGVGSKNAQIVSQTVPTTMVAGQQYPVSVAVKNTGSLTWSPIGPQCGAYRLAQIGSTAWNPTRTELPAPLSSGGQVTLNYNVVAPTTPGSYNFQVRMVHECVEFFGDLGPNVVVNVQPAPLKKAVFLAQNVPSTMVAGQTYPVSVTIRNDGNVTWSPIGPQCNAYRLAQVGDAAWNPIRVELPTPLAPGQQVTLPFNVTAPATGGTYNFQLKMVHECVEFFNDPGPNVAVSVACAPSATKLCLQNGRFEVTVDFVNGTTQSAQTRTFSNQSGFFTFFDPANPEVGVKIVDGRSVNGKWWVYYGALTGLQYTVRVTDTVTHGLKTYLHSASTGTSLCGGADTGAFLAAKPAGEATVELAADVSPGKVLSKAACVPSATRVCLLGGRFQVEVTRAGVSQGAVQLTDLAGVFWFFDPEWAEVPVKLIDGRGVNGKFWVYFGSLTDQSYQVAVTDTVSGLTKTYMPPAVYCGMADVNAF
jgi:hypothetical protein